MTRRDLLEGGAVLVEDLRSGEESVSSPEEACISPLDRGFLYGDAAFETLRCYEGEPTYLEEHADKLNEALDALSIPAELTGEDLRARIQRLLPELPDDTVDAYVRVSVTRGEREGLLAPTETSPTLVCVAKPLDTRRYAPASTEVVDVRRPDGVLGRLKTHNYLSSVLAKRETDADEALLRDRGGRIASGAVSNLFVFCDGRLCTPADNVREGVTREAVLDVARHLGLATRVGTVESLDDVEAAFLTNSTWGVRPIKSIDGTELDVNYEWVERLADEYFERVVP